MFKTLQRFEYLYKSQACCGLNLLQLDNYRHRYWAFKAHCAYSDLQSLPTVPAVDQASLALGTTIKVTGSKAAFRAVHFDANLAVARAAQDAGARHAGLVSEMGANVHSRIFYNCGGKKLARVIGRLL